MYKYKYNVSKIEDDLLQLCLQDSLDLELTEGELVHTTPHLQSLSPRISITFLCPLLEACLQLLSRKCIICDGEPADMISLHSYKGQVTMLYLRRRVGL